MVSPAHVQLSRFFSLTDLVVVIVVAVALLLPPRALEAQPADKLPPEERTALAFAEARVHLRPDDGVAVYDLGRRLGEAKQSDWAVQAAAVAAARTPASPTRWRSLLAASVAHADRFEADLALDFATQSLAACAEAGEIHCPSWEQVRVELYQRHLDAGVKSGIDPRKNPTGFREAGESALRTVRATGTGTSGTGSGSGSGTGSGTDPGTGSGTGSGTDPGTGSGTDPGTGSGTDPGTGSGTGTGSAP